MDFRNSLTEGSYITGTTVTTGNMYWKHDIEGNIVKT